MQALSTRDFRTALLVYLLYVGLSLVTYFLIPPEQDIGANYDGMARNLISGRGLTDPSTPKPSQNVPYYSLIRLWEEHNLIFGVARPNQPSAFCEPAYTVWLAFWFRLLGPNSFLVILQQILFMGLILPMIYYLGIKIFNRKVGLFASLLLLFHPYLLRFPHSYPQENLLLPLLLGGLCAWYWLREKPTSGKVLVFALLGVVAGLTRMVGVYLTLFTTVLLVVTTPAVRKYLWIIAAVLLVGWGGWVLRNALVIGEARLFPTKAGYNWWLENNRLFLNQQAEQKGIPFCSLWFSDPAHHSFLVDSLGFTEAQVQQYARYDFPPNFWELDESKIDHELNRRFKLFFREQPRVMLSYFFWRSYKSFVDELGPLGRLSKAGLQSAYFALLFTLGIAGFFLALRHFRQAWLILLLTVVHEIILILGVSAPRYRAPLDLLLVIYAGLSLATLWNWITKRGQAAVQELPSSAESP